MSVGAGLRETVTILAVFAALGACTEQPAAPAVATATELAPVPERAPKALLGKLTGEVAVKRAAGDEWLKAEERLRLFDNDKVRTARGASAEVIFTNGSRLTVGEDALVGIAETRPMPGADPSDVTVLKGRIDAELTDSTSQSLVVTTPSATVRAGREIVFQ